MSPTNSAAPDWDEMRTNARRNQILKAATRVFSEKGYHRATTKDIARAAEMAEGTIYLYFKSKGEILIALMEHFDQATTQSPDLAAGLDLSLRDLLTERLKQDLAQLGPNFNLLMAILPEALADPGLRAQFYQRLVIPGLTGITEHLETRRERGEVRVSDAPMTARIFMAAILGLDILYILGDEPVRAAWQDPQAMAEAIAQVMIDGMQPSER